MELTVLPLTAALARQLLAWRYPEPYANYNLTDDEQTLAELLSGGYYAAVAADGQLPGFFCFGQPAQVPACGKLGAYAGNALDVGLGLRPDLTGVGQGLAFLTAGMAFAYQTLGAAQLRLTVLKANQRAIAVYQRAGWQPQGEYTTNGPDGQRQWLVMTHFRPVGG